MNIERELRRVYVFHTPSVCTGSGAEKNIDDSELGDYASVFKSFDKTIITKMTTEVLVFVFLKLFCLMVFKESPVCF